LVFSRLQFESSLNRDEAQKVDANFVRPDPRGARSAAHETAADADAANANSPRSLEVSCKTGEGLEILRRVLDKLCFGKSDSSAVLALNARHVQAIEAARAALRQAAGQVVAGPEFIAMDLREALDALGQISGRVSTDDLLGRIFAAFCIGK
jgi:tRNA modification GTPase